MKTWKPTTAGVLEIVAGALHLIASVATILVAGGVAAGMYWLRGSETEQVPLDEDPSQLKAAVVFGLLYAAILFSVAAGQQWLGNRGLYLVAALSGLTDMDAITLSTAQLIKRGELDVDTGWRMILLGSLSNIVFKGAAVAVLGHRRLLRRVSVAFGVVLLCGGLLWLLWP